jgi:hypothetical protein
MIDVDILIYYPLKFRLVDNNLQKDLFINMLDTNITMSYIYN